MRPCLRQIVYVSRATELPDVESISIVSHRNNSRDDITGLLLCDSTRYLHILEGARDPVEACLSRIEADRRHRHVDVMLRRDIGSRTFDEFRVLCNVDGAIARQAYVDAIKETVECIREPELQALFIGFGFMAAISRGGAY